MYPKSSGRTDSLRTAGIAADPVAACQKCASRAQLSAQLLATCEDTAKCGCLPIAGVYIDPLENLTAADPNCLRQIRNVDWLKLSNYTPAGFKWIRSQMRVQAGLMVLGLDAMRGFGKAIGFVADLQMLC